MAKSRYEYVKQFESEDSFLRNCWAVVRVDGRCFHKFTDLHEFEKPNDVRALHLMNLCAQNVVREYPDIVLAYGQSDEYSFVLARESKLFRRRASKIISNIVSLFSSSYVFHWSKFFPSLQLQYPPVFDGRVVCYPTDQNLHDYLSWRQADCHINNLYNTCFWNLVKKANVSKVDAEAELCGTISSDKHELLFSRFGINYNDVEAIFRKGSVIVRELVQQKELRSEDSMSPALAKVAKSGKKRVVVLHEDMIGKGFWSQHPGILPSKVDKNSIWKN